MKLNQSAYLFVLTCLLLLSSTSRAAVLPDERADAMYHSYDGDEIQVTGPAILIRKNVGASTSVFYQYYEDNITSASIDVRVGGSPYEEFRTENSVGVDYLNGKTTMNLSYTDSSENDYEAGTFSVGISQDFFGDLSTLSMGFSQGTDSVTQRTGNNPTTFSSELSNIKRTNYRVGFSQILTKNSTISLGWETITDEATEQGGSGVTLNNPYRSYSYGTPGVNRFFAREIYPNTRTSNALGIRGNYFINAFKSAIHYEYRWFQDSWGIQSNSLGLSYVHPVKNWELDFRWRYYEQDKADFYRDMFDFANQFTYMGRDKELSTYTSMAVGISGSYKFAKNGWGWIDKGSVNLSYDLINFEYHDFRAADDTTANPGEEPFFQFEAEVVQATVSIWF